VLASPTDSLTITVHSNGPITRSHNVISKQILKLTYKYKGDWHSITRPKLLRLAAARAGYFTNLQPSTPLLPHSYTIDTALPHADLIVATLSHRLPNFQPAVPVRNPYSASDATSEFGEVK
jgi:hypothetical protein